MTDARPFEIHVSDDQLDDLVLRLERSRLLAESPRRAWSGLTADYLAALIASWKTFDWRERERWLNSHPQYLVDLDGSDLHFVHLRSQRADAPALLVMHGWPHTFALQLDFADLLPDFHVVVPSFPGFAFSSPYADGEVSETRLAATMHSLMTDVLGYDSYFTYGEDVSANVNDLLASIRSASIRGIIATHSHFPTGAERESLTDPAETAFFERIASDRGPHGAYGHVQATRPDTLAVGLNDSPAGLVAWIAEKLIEWSDTPKGDPFAVENRISRERILTEAMIYWVTQSIATSFRPYYEGADQPASMAPAEVPAAIFIQRHEGDYPESLARAFYLDVRVFARLEEGGHFAAAEVPSQMAERVRRFANSLSGAALSP